MSDEPNKLADETGTQPESPVAADEQSATPVEINAVPGRGCRRI